MEPIMLNCRRLLCPMPVIRIQEQIKTLQDGQQMVVTCTDPGVRNDVPAWCRIHGHEVNKIEDQDGEIIITITAHQS
ncbi:MAG: sulfurtransferase TusA family protein [Pseudomonadales bacterium]